MLEFMRTEGVMSVSKPEKSPIQPYHPDTGGGELERDYQFRKNYGALSQREGMIVSKTGEAKNKPSFYNGITDYKP